MSDIIMQSEKSNSQQIEECKEYPQRYTSLLGFILISASFSLTMTTFNPISADASTIYNIKPIIVNMNSLVINLIHLPLSLPVGILVQRIGIQNSMRIAGILALIGVWIRTFLNHSFYFALLGSIILGIGAPICSNLITTLSLIWFRAEKRESITRILMLSYIVFIAGCSMLSGQWLRNYDSDEDNEQENNKGKNLVQSLMQIEAYIASGLVVVGVLIFGDKPPTPPSLSASQKRENIQKQIKILLKNKDYILILICFSLFAGTYHSMGVTLSFILKPFGFTSTTVSYVGFSIIISGIIGNGVGSYLFKKNPRFKAYLLFGILGSIVGYGLTMILLPFEKKPLAMVPYIVIGGTSIQSFPVYLELASECGFPVAESFSSGFLQGMSQMAGFIFGIIFSLILDSETKGEVYIVQICNIGVFAICIFTLKIMKVKLNRKNIDAKNDNEVIIINEEDNTNNQLLIQSNNSSATS